MTSSRRSGCRGSSARSAAPCQTLRRGTREGHLGIEDDGFENVLFFCRFRPTVRLQLSGVSWMLLLLATVAALAVGVGVGCLAAGTIDGHARRTLDAEQPTGT